MDTIPVPGKSTSQCSGQALITKDRAHIQQLLDVIERTFIAVDTDLAEVSDSFVLRLPVSGIQNPLNALSAVNPGQDYASRPHAVPEALPQGWVRRIWVLTNAHLDEPHQS